MSNDTFQETLFEDPLGLRFRHARERRRLSVEAVAQKLKLPAAVIEAIEREDWARLGAPIYVRSYVGSYARLLELPPEIADEVARSRPTPALVTVVSKPAASVRFERSLASLGYVAMTLAIVGGIVMLAAHFRNQGGIATLLPLDPPVPAKTVVAAKPEPVAAPAAQAPAATGPLAPMMASLAPGVAADAPAQPLVLKFRDQSWLDVTGSDGKRIERGLVAAGSERVFPAGTPVNITIGKLDAVSASIGGRDLDLEPFRQAEIARFTLSSGGRVGAVEGD